MLRRKIYRFKIFRWHFYFSRAHLNVFYAHQPGRLSLARRMRELRNRRYRQTKGCCEVCGEWHTVKEFQMHHAFPFGKFPQWRRKYWNVVMLCPHCHYIIHADPTMQMELMKRVARKRGINLQRECRSVAEQMWHDLQEKTPRETNLSN